MAQLRNNIQIPVEQIRIGMFVAALDRSWRGTPFLMQGFQVLDDDDIAKLKQQSKTVTIDPTHSTPGCYEHLADLHVAQSSEGRGWLKRLRERFGKFDETSAALTDERQKAGLIPAGVTPNVYGEMKLIDAEIERAEVVFEATDATMAQISRQVANGEKVNLVRLGGEIETMVESTIANPDALLWVARIRSEDAATYTHGVRVAIYLLQLGRHLGFPPPQLANLATLGLLLDLGKIRVDRAVLHKPGKLSASEFDTAKKHVELGLAALDASGNVDPDVRLGIAQHHERLDGSGYPAGLAGAAISIYGRMAAVADSFAALTSPRPYAEPLPAYDALKLLYGEAGKSYHAPLIEQFVQAIGAFPAGSLVELTSGEVATVLAHNRVRRLEPRVLVLTDSEKQPLREPRSLDLLLQPKSADGKDIKIVRGLPTGAFGLDLRNFNFT